MQMRYSPTIYVTAKAVAGALWGLYGYASKAIDERMIDTATGDNLDRLGYFEGVFRLPATQSRGAVSFTGTDGVTIPSGWIYL